jgi:hypothetical protein
MLASSLGISTTSKPAVRDVISAEKQMRDVIYPKVRGYMVRRM